jgi:hypothetical protein
MGHASIINFFSNENTQELAPGFFISGCLGKNGRASGNTLKKTARFLSGAILNRTNGSSTAASGLPLSASGFWERRNTPGLNRKPSRTCPLPKTPERRKPDRMANSVAICIKLTLSEEEARAVGRDLAYIKAGRDRKIIHPVTYRFLVRVFKEAKTVSLNAYMQGRHMFTTLYETGFEP